MEKLIEALQIFLKYKNENRPTHCEHDILMVVGITEQEVSQEDKDKLSELGFRWHSEYDCWSSFRYGSA
jgi:hypothetical protein